MLRTTTALICAKCWRRNNKLKKTFADIYWAMILWLLYKMPLLIVIVWLAVALFLGYECYEGNGNEIAEYSRFGYPETYKFCLIVWVAFAALILWAICISRKKNADKK